MAQYHDSSVAISYVITGLTMIPRRPYMVTDIIMSIAYGPAVAPVSNIECPRETLKRHCKMGQYMRLVSYEKNNYYI